jgi:hypothetical protein
MTGRGEVTRTNTLFRNHRGGGRVEALTLDSRLRGNDEKRQAVFEHLLNTKRGRNIPQNQGVAKVLKERL